MKILFLLIAASFLVASCASFRGPKEAGVGDCRKAYARQLKMYFAIVSENQGAVNSAQGSLSDLEREVHLALQHCPGEQSRVLALMANIEIIRGENEKALAHARLAEELDPDIWETNASLGDVLTLRGDFERGLSHTEKASRLAPKNIYLQYNLCTTYEVAKHYQQALAACTAVIETGEPSVLGPALYVRARAYKAIGQVDKAEVDFKRSKTVGYDGAKHYSKEHLEKGNKDQ